MVIADEIDSQLARRMASFIADSNSKAKTTARVDHPPPRQAHKRRLATQAQLPNFCAPEREPLEPLDVKTQLPVHN
jgi:hypothetical protein